MREVHDSLGTVFVPDDALYGAVTARALDKFKIGDNLMPFEITEALVRIKQAAATVNAELGLLDENKARAIENAADEILNGKYREQFPLSVWQTGSGTQSNMNVNEVIAEIGRRAGMPLHPNDDVNMAQSTNDTFSSALHISARKVYSEALAPALTTLIAEFDKLAKENENVIKLGRTHCMDATPMRFSSEILAWRDVIGQSFLRIDDAADRLKFLALGGTAIGSGINAHPEFGKRVSEKLGFQADPNAFYQIAHKDTILHFHSTLKTLATGLLKISNDIRFYASGPMGGLQEVQIPANEPGSSIMPGKVNPTQIEALTQVCAEVIGNDTSVSFVASFGNFQLNTYMPLFAFKTLESLRLLSDAINSFRVNLLAGLKPNVEQMTRNLSKSLSLVTALNPVIGYELSAQIAKKALAEHRTIHEVALELTDLDEAKLNELLDPAKML